MPNGKTWRLTKGSDKPSRITKVDVLLSEYIINGKPLTDYIEENWLSNISQNEFNLLPEDKVKNFLDRLGSYILQGEFKYGGILTERKEEKIKSAEIPVSSCAPDISALFYSSGATEEDNLGSNNTLRLYEEDDIKMQEPAKKSKRLKDTAFYQINHLPEALYREWIYVWGNEIEFDGKVFYIKDNDDYTQDEDGCSRMMKILCCKTDTGYLFYDELIESIGDCVVVV